MTVRQQRKRLIILFLLLMIALSLSISLGRFPIPFSDQMKVLLPATREEVSPQAFFVLKRIRLPRLLAGMMVGIALSTSGASYQALFQNPMVSPSLLGASAGAGFGAALGIFFGQNYMMITLLSFSSGLLAVLLTQLISRRFRFDNILGLVLTGMVVSALFTAMVSFIKLVADPENTLPAITYWLMGSLSGVGWKEVQFAFFPILVGFIPIMLLRWQINILAMGEEEALSMGVPVGFLKRVLIVSATLMTAASVSISGMIGWIGLIVPHLARNIVGVDLRYNLPASALLGASFLVMVDTLARIVHTSEIPIGILTAMVGAPLFLVLMMKVGANR